MDFVSLIEKAAISYLEKHPEVIEALVEKIVQQILAKLSGK